MSPRHETSKSSHEPDGAAGIDEDHRDDRRLPQPRPDRRRPQGDV